MTRKPARADDDRARKAHAVIERVENETETAGTSSFARIARRTERHFAGADADQDDRAEVWGRRIGRTAGLAFAVLLVVYLFLALA